MTSFRGKIVVPSTVIPEACYLLNTYLGPEAEIAFVDSLLKRELSVENIGVPDFVRCVELLKKYEKLNLGLVDASVIAVAERLKIQKVLTTDRRHFSAVRPKHFESFVLLP